jgi:tetratricopeptide (TPR) repeat protein/DNA-binding XRE family transcriptional regulator
MFHPNRIAYYRDRCAPPLTQAELAALLAVHLNTVQNWERGGVARPRALLRLARVFVERGALAAYHDALSFWRSASRGGYPPPPELRALFARGDPSGASGLLALPLGAVPPPARRCGTISYPFNERFVGREADLRVIAALLRTPGTVAALCGAGGLGKTQLAVMFAYHYGAHFPGGVYWIDAADPEEIATQVAASGDESLHAHFARLGFARRLELVQAAWREPVPRLLIFDNCENPAALFEWRPPTGGCRILATSRTREWTAYEAAQVVELQPIARGASIALLRAFGPIRRDDTQTLERIAAAVGDLPLALHLAGSYLAYSGVDAAVYAEQLEHPRSLRHASFQGFGPSPTDYSWSLAEAIARSYERLGDSPLDTMARAILDLVRFLAPAAPIPTELLIDALELPTEQRAGALAALHHLSEHLSLIDLQPEAQSIRVHPLIHAFLNEAPPCQDCYRALMRAAHARAAAADRHGHVFSAALTLQLRYLADQARARGAPEAAELWTALAFPLSNAGQFAAARHYAEGAIELCERTLGPEHPSTADALNTLALIIQMTETFLGVEKLYRRAQAIWERAYGPESEQVATVHNNAGYLAALCGRYGEADTHLRQALRLRRKLVGLRDLSTARVIRNYGFLALTMGLPRKAERYLRLALALQQQAFGQPSLVTAFTLELLAQSLLAQKRLDAARGYAAEALTMRQTLGGEMRELVAPSLGVCAEIARAAGELEEAARLGEEVAQMRRAMQKEDEPGGLTESALLGGIYLDQGRIEEARALLTHAVEGLRATAGEESQRLKAAWAELRRLEAMGA